MGKSIKETLVERALKGESLTEAQISELSVYCAKVYKDSQGAEDDICFKRSRVLDAYHRASGADIKATRKFYNEDIRPLTRFLSFKSAWADVLRYQLVADCKKELQETARLLPRKTLESFTKRVLFDSDGKQVPMDKILSELTERLTELKDVWSDQEKIRSKLSFAADRILGQYQDSDGNSGNPKERHATSNDTAEIKTNNAPGQMTAKVIANMTKAVQSDKSDQFLALLTSIPEATRILVSLSQRGEGSPYWNMESHADIIEAIDKASYDLKMLRDRHVRIFGETNKAKIKKAS